MGLVTREFTYSSGAVIVASQHNTNENTLYNLVNGNLNTSNLASNASIVDTQLAQITTASKVSGSSITSLSSIPSGAGVIPSANVPSIPPVNYRVGMNVKQASTTTITVEVGQVEVNGTLISKTTTTTLTLGTAADWAGGSSLRATSTYGYVGIDASGNIKMHTTAPSHVEYGVSTTAGVKRYVTWSSTVYRVIGWFYMNATGSGELNDYEVSNLNDAGARNMTFTSGASSASSTSTSFTEILTMHFYSTGGPVSSRAKLTTAMSSIGSASAQFEIDTTDKTNSLAGAYNDNGDPMTMNPLWVERLSQGTHAIKLEFSRVRGTNTMEANEYVVEIAEF